MSDAVKVRDNDKPGAPAQPPRPNRRTIAPRVDVFENGHEVLVVADVPGVSADALEIRVESDTLTLEAQRVLGDGRALAREYEEVDYARSFRIPAGIDTPNVSAEVKNGTLTVRLPKAEAVKARKIAVRSN